MVTGKEEARASGSGIESDSRSCASPNSVAWRFVHLPPAPPTYLDPLTSPDKTPDMLRLLHTLTSFVALKDPDLFYAATTVVGNDAIAPLIQVGLPLMRASPAKAPPAAPSTMEARALQA